MNRHHPDESLLLGLAAGTLDVGTALVVAAHVEQCAECRKNQAALEATGGVLLDTLKPEPLAPTAFADTLARIHSLSEMPARAATPRHSTKPRPDLPDGLEWPRALDHCDITPWKSLGPGMRWSRIYVPRAPQANVFLLRMGAGKQLALHTHTGRELTQVLYGAFADGRSTWRAGDLDEADESILHRPVVAPDSECICLASVEGHLRFDGLLARALGRWMGI